MTAPVSDRAPVIDVRRIRELGEWEALDAYRAECAAASVEELTGRGSAAFYLRQAALEAVIAERMRVLGTISIHRALLAGASVPEIADVMDAGCEQIAERWRSWADAVHEWRQAAHQRGTVCQPEDLPEPGGELGFAAGVLSEEDAVAYPYLVQHVPNCPLGAVGDCRRRCGEERIRLRPRCPGHSRDQARPHLSARRAANRQGVQHRRRLARARQGRGV